MLILEDSERAVNVALVVLEQAEEMCPGCWADWPGDPGLWCEACRIEVEKEFSYENSSELEMES